MTRKQAYYLAVAILAMVMMLWCIQSSADEFVPVRRAAAGPPPPTGSCCGAPSAGQCQDDYTEAECTSANGTWSEGLTCAQSCGACCVENPPTLQGCVETQTSTECDALGSGGSYSWGANTTCAANCGTCCTAGTCTQEDSAGSCPGGDFTAGNECDVDGCPGVGACCQDQGPGTCSVLTSAACSTAGGVYRGDSTTCASSCGSCCNDVGGGECSESRTQAGCEGNGGVWTANGTCAATCGSCCDAGVCTNTTQAGCSATWTAGADCVPNDCPSPEPAACGNLWGVWHYDGDWTFYCGECDDLGANCDFAAQGAVPPTFSTGGASIQGEWAEGFNASGYADAATQDTNWVPPPTNTNYLTWGGLFQVVPAGTGSGTGYAVSWGQPTLDGFHLALNMNVGAADQRVECRYGTVIRGTNNYLTRDVEEMVICSRRDDGSGNGDIALWSDDRTVSTTAVTNSQWVSPGSFEMFLGMRSDTTSASCDDCSVSILFIYANQINDTQACWLENCGPANEFSCSCSADSWTGGRGLTCASGGISLSCDTPLPAPAY